MDRLAAHYDAVVIGGGVGGGAFATVMAREGFSILVLERDTEYRDRVRGEWIAPWGVVELQRMGLYDALVAAGGHHIARHVRYGDDAAPDPLAVSLDMTALVPGIPGPLALRHPVICETFSRTATEAGATVLRGVRDVRIMAGPSPRVAFTHEGQPHEAACDLVIGADGRNSAVRQQAGIELHRDPPHHLFTGLLVEGAHGWDASMQATGTEDEVNYLIFPQGNGRVRLYIGFPYEQKSVYSGPEGPRRFLEAFRLATLPGSETFANATPAGPCNAYPNEDTWTDEPFIEGVVLIGDAAGWNDPIVGQGLSITLRDVRIVTDILRDRDQWCVACLQPYAEERAERMRRLRHAGSITATIDAEFGPEKQAQRRRARARMVADPSLSLAMLGVMVGPEAIPPQAYDPSLRERLFAPDEGADQAR